MAKTQTRFTRYEIVQGVYKLPANLSFVGKVKYSAVVHRLEGEQWNWYIELPVGVLLGLVEPQSESLDSTAQIERLERELSISQRKIEEQKFAINQVMEKYNLLLQNVEEHYVEKPGVKSAKNYFEVARERGTDLSMRPLSGGRPGNSKK